jgi:hypothetical protein
MSHDEHGHQGASAPRVRIARGTLLKYGIPILLVLTIFTIYWAPEVAAFFYSVVAFFAPLWLPALLVWIAWPVWLTFARSYFVSGIPYSTIELKPGPETPRTARPMELAFYSLYHRTEVTKRDFLFGRMRSPWSFETYLHAGTARFFLHVPKSHVEAVEARIRAEYHDMEIEPVRDYAREIAFHPTSMRVYAREYSLSKADPYPLKTYERYEASAQRRDVFSEMLEELAAVGRNEHLLISYIIRPHQRERRSYFEEPRDTLHEDAYKVIGDIVGPKGELHALPTGKQAVVTAIEAALRKPSFDCGIRALYIADKAAYREDFAKKLDHLFDRFNDEELNGFRAYDPAERTGFLRGEILAMAPYLKAEYLVHLFRRRAFFAPPYIGTPFVLNTEELATVFHMPQAGRGSVVSIRSAAKLEPPENLPV